MDNNKTVVEFKLKKRSFEEQINYAKNQLKKFPYEYRTFLFFKHQFTEIKEGIERDFRSKTGRSYKSVFQDLTRGIHIDSKPLIAVIKQINAVNVEIDYCREQMNKFILGG